MDDVKCVCVCVFVLYYNMVESGIFVRINIKIHLMRPSMVISYFAKA